MGGVCFGERGGELLGCLAGLVLLEAAGEASILGGAVGFLAAVLFALVEGCLTGFLE